MLDDIISSGRKAVATPRAETLRAAPTRYYRPELDALRFLAFLLVYLHHIIPNRPEGHANTWARNFPEVGAAIANAFGFGLPLFFFLSAYLITTLLLIEMRSGALDFKGFYIRRVLRIWPLYFVGIAIGLGFAAFRHDPDQFTMMRMFSVFIGNFYFQTHGWSGNVMSPLWSISVEEQFYLVAPALIWLAGARRAWLAGLAIAALALIAVYVQGEMHREVAREIWTNTLSQMLFFGAGITMAALTMNGPPKIPVRWRFGFAAMAAALFFAAAYWGDANRYAEARSGALVAIGYFGVAAGCVLLLLALLDAPVKPPSWLIYLGKISYGLYVFHYAAIWVTYRVPGMPRDLAPWLALAPTIALAALSYQVLEKPFLRLRERFTHVRNRAI